MTAEAFLLITFVLLAAYAAYAVFNREPLPETEPAEQEPAEAAAIRARRAARVQARQAQANPQGFQPLPFDEVASNSWTPPAPPIPWD